MKSIKKYQKIGPVLITNDDGIHSQGLNVLENIANKLFEDVWVVAPEKNCSGSGHSLTIDKPLRLRKISDKKFAVNGTPVDCVIMAIKETMRLNFPILLLSGINIGANLGGDVHYSGTVAAAREGCLNRIPSIAISQFSENNKSINWKNINNNLSDLIFNLDSFQLPKNYFLNINYPDTNNYSIKGIKVTNLSIRKPGNKIEKRVDLRGGKYFWISTERNQIADKSNTDLNAILNSYISITLLNTYSNSCDIPSAFLKKLKKNNSELKIEFK